MFLKSRDIKGIDQRETEKSQNSNFFSKIKSKLYTILNNDPYSLKCIKEVFKDLNIKKLEQGIWVYKDDYFNPIKNKLIDINKYWSLDMFKNIELLEDMLNTSNNTLNFDCNIEARNKCNKMIESLITNPIINKKNDIDKEHWDTNSILDKESYNNFINAVKKADTEWLKLVILSNHQSHMDTFILNYIFHNLYKEINTQYDLSQKELRFICGAYMYYMDNTRAAPVWFNTTFVFGAKDMPEIVSFFKKEKNIQILKKVKNAVSTAIKSNHKKESSLLYVYAWRSEEDNWCKEKIEEWIKPFVSNKDCLYIPIWFNGSRKLYNNSTKTIIPKQIIKTVKPNKEISWFVYFKPSKIIMNIWESFKWWDKSLEEINIQMHQTSNKALDRKNNLTKK